MGSPCARPDKCIAPASSDTLVLAIKLTGNPVIIGGEITLASDKIVRYIHGYKLRSYFHKTVSLGYTTLRSTCVPNLTLLGLYHI